MHLVVNLAVKLEVTEDALFQKAVAQALREHADFLAKGDVTAFGKHGPVCWEATLSE